MKNKLKKIILVLLLVSLSLSSSCTRPRLQKFKTSYLDIFDTVSIIMAYAPNKKEFEDMADIIKVELLNYHKLFDIYNDYEGINNIKSINDKAGISPVEVEDEIIDLIEFSIEVYHLTDGYVNIALGPVLSIWHDHREEALNNPNKAKIPDINILREAKQISNIEDIIIDKDKNTVYLNKKGMKLDVGAIAKGFAVESIGKKLVASGYDHILINIGGNIKTIGLKPDGSNWILGIENPQGGLYAKTQMGQGSLVTSGNYQRYYVVDGKSYHHIINKDTLMPADYYQSVSVKAKDSGLADALSTALFTMTIEDGKKILKEGIEVMWMDKDMKKRTRGGFEIIK